MARSGRPRPAGVRMCTVALTRESGSLAEWTVMSSTQVYKVIGMTCGHCVAAVTDEVSHLRGVADVSVHLVKHGESTLTLTLDEPVDATTIARAIDEAGYELAG